MKKTKTQKGITLVALIITIVVLLILAVVAIQEIVGDGIITYATTAMENQKIAQIKEEAELVKTEAQAEYFLSGRTLDQAELLRLINEHFEGSTIEENAVILKDGKYKIEVDADKNITVGKNEDEEDGNGESTAVRGDVKVSHTVTKDSSGYRIELTIELLGIPAYNEEELLYSFLENEVLPGMSTQELIIMSGKEYLGQTLDAEQVYDAMYKSEFNNISYQEFMANKDGLVQAKYNVPTADIAIKKLILEKTAGENYNNILNYGIMVQRSKQILPEFIEKQEIEIADIVEGWYNREYTFEQLTGEFIAETFGEGVTLDQAVTQLNVWTGFSEENYIFDRKDGIILISAQITPNRYISIEYPENGTTDITLFDNTDTVFTDSYYVTEPGSYTIKVTGPSGNTVEEVVNIVTPKVELDKTEITKNIIDGNQITETLTATLIDLEGKITWTTSNDSVAIVEGTGTTVNVILKSKGKATITATCGEYTATCKISVANNNPEAIVPTITATGNFVNNPNIAEVREGNVPIPTGYTYVKGNVDGGVVIKDSIGNEWVWVPATVSEISEVVNGENVGKLYDFSTTGATAKTYPTTSNSGNREPDVVTKASSGSDSTTGTSYDGDTDNLSIVLEGEYANTKTAASFKAQLQAEFDNMIESISKYGGYYIGRYEAGGTINSPVLQQGATVIRNTDSSSNWYYMYTSAKKLAANESVTTGMIWGCQWDNTLRWLVNSNNLSWSDLTDSSEWGNYKDSTGNAATNSGEGRSAGYSEYWKAGNIYDLAGNYYDWTLEAYSTSSRVSRGGGYYNSGDSYPASVRVYSTPTTTNGYYTFRPTLIIE